MDKPHNICRNHSNYDLLFFLHSLLTIWFLRVSLLRADKDDHTECCKWEMRISTFTTKLRRNDVLLKYIYQKRRQCFCRPTKNGIAGRGESWCETSKGWSWCDTADSICMEGSGYSERSGCAHRVNEAIWDHWTDDTRTENANRSSMRRMLKHNNNYIIRGDMVLIYSELQYDISGCSETATMHASLSQLSVRWRSRPGG